MRALMIALTTLTPLSAAVADDNKTRKIDNCSYLLSGGQSIDLAVGANACVRSPPPYSDSYALLRCFPPIQEIELVKRGDPRCGEKYEDRERRK